jgi:hypothetical protein
VTSATRAMRSLAASMSDSSTEAIR